MIGPEVVSLPPTLRNRTFFSLAELNAAIREKLAVINHRVMKKMGMSRQKCFEHIDRPALKPLPSERFEMAEWKYCRVNVDYHVEVDHNYYSVPYTLLHERLEARFTPSIVELSASKPPHHLPQTSLRSWAGLNTPRAYAS